MGIGKKAAESYRKISNAMNPPPPPKANPKAQIKSNEAGMRSLKAAEAAGRARQAAARKK